MELALKYKESYPLASDILLNFCYVDDALYTCSDLETLWQAHAQLTELLNKAGMKLHKWCSNSEEFTNSISNVAQSPNYIIPQQECSNKVLGLY